MLYHDNASSHTTQQTVYFLRENKVTVIPHPPYSPDLAMCVFWLFFNLKKYLRGRRFTTEEEIYEAIHHFLRAFPKLAGFMPFSCGSIGYNSALM
jgi:histone-lysine N-methyltransferase SETMAR